MTKHERLRKLASIGEELQRKWDAGPRAGDLVSDSDAAPVAATLRSASILRSRVSTPEASSAGAGEWFGGILPGDTVEVLSGSHWQPGTVESVDGHCVRVRCSAGRDTTVIDLTDPRLHSTLRVIGIGDAARTDAQRRRAARIVTKPSANVLQFDTQSDNRNTRQDKQGQLNSVHALQVGDAVDVYSKSADTWHIGRVVHKTENELQLQYAGDRGRIVDLRDANLHRVIRAPNRECLNIAPAAEQPEKPKVSVQRGATMAVNSAEGEFVDSAATVSCTPSLAEGVQADHTTIKQQIVAIYRQHNPQKLKVSAC